MLLGSISKRFDTIVEFIAFEDFISFEKKGKNKVKRVENLKAYQESYGSKEIKAELVEYAKVRKRKMFI